MPYCSMDNVCQSEINYLLNNPQDLFRIQNIDCTRSVAYNNILKLKVSTN
jgi:hypothetical protein